MRKCHAMLFLVVLLSAQFIPALAAEVEQASATLYPGQTVTVMGIKITWNFKEKQAPGLPMGTFDIVGPVKSIKDMLAKHMTIMTIYIDEVALAFKQDMEGAIPLSKFFINTKKYSSKYNMGGRPYNLNCFVSNLCPITINELNIRVSDEKKIFPDGSSYYMLEFEDSRSGEKTSIPMNSGAQGQAFRANVYVSKVFEETKTTQVRLDAGPDYTIRGKDAFIDKFDLGDHLHHPIKDFLDEFGEKYGFTVKWIPYPDHPESVELAQSCNLNLSYSVYTYNSIIVEKIIKDLERDNSYLTFDWETPTILAVSYKNYDKYLEYKKHEGEKNEKDQKTREEFKKDYSLETKAYPIKTVSVQTDKSLITPELDTYYLAMVDNDAHLEIIPGRNVNKKLPIIKIDKVEESAEADEKTGMLFLTATEKTHEKFMSLMQAMDAWVGKAAKPANVKPYKVIVTLLEGFENPRLSLPTIDAAKAAEQYGINKEDLKIAGINVVREFSTGLIYLLPEKGDVGKASLSLTNGFSCHLEYIDQREPYMIFRVSLDKVIKDENSVKDVNLFENTLYLTLGKSTLMGITNLENAYIVILKLEAAEKEQK
ncbi:MAG: hypothetical protein NT106_08510 [Candidatus Sumerlaeota bacterium]|nr:hypothetical protein [Candidatus Sumerlaeota bacterium]